jgi:sulfur transfer protein SufE
MLNIRSDFEQLLFLADAYARGAVNSFNSALSGLTPIEIAILTIAAVIITRFVSETLSMWRKLGLKTIIFRAAIKLPFVKGKVASELNSMRADF